MNKIDHVKLERVMNELKKARERFFYFLMKVVGAGIVIIIIKRGSHVLKDEIVRYLIEVNQTI